MRSRVVILLALSSLVPVGTTPAEPSGNRLLLTGYRDLLSRVLMLQIDPATGADQRV